LKGEVVRYLCTNCQYELISEEDIEGEICEACNAGTMSCEEENDEDKNE
jgi:peptide subunit release factor 1 (eRF1)